MFAGVQHGERPIKHRRPRSSRAASQRCATTSPIWSGNSKPPSRCADPTRLPRRRAAGERRGEMSSVSPRSTRNTSASRSWRQTKQSRASTSWKSLSSGQAPRNVALGSCGASSSSGDYAGARRYSQAGAHQRRQVRQLSQLDFQRSGRGWVQLELAEPNHRPYRMGPRSRRDYADRLAVKYQIEVAVEPGRGKSWRRRRIASRSAPGQAERSPIRERQAAVSS